MHGELIHELCFNELELQFFVLDVLCLLCIGKRALSVVLLYVVFLCLEFPDETALAPESAILIFCL